MSEVTRTEFEALQDKVNSHGNMMNMLSNTVTQVSRTTDKMEHAVNEIRALVTPFTDRVNNLAGSNDKVLQAVKKLSEAIGEIDRSLATHVSNVSTSMTHVTEHLVKAKTGAASMDAAWETLRDPDLKDLAVNVCVSRWPAKRAQFILDNYEFSEVELKNLTNQQAFMIFAHWVAINTRTNIVPLPEADYGYRLVTRTQDVKCVLDSGTMEDHTSLLTSAASVCAELSAAEDKDFGELLVQHTSSFIDELNVEKFGERWVADYHYGEEYFQLHIQIS